MKCSFCGHELESGSNFCPECGTMMGFDDEAPQEKNAVAPEQKYEPDNADTYQDAEPEETVLVEQPEEDFSVPEYVPKAPTALEDYNTIRSNEEAAEAKNDLEEDDPFAELHPADDEPPAVFAAQEKAESNDYDDENSDGDDDMYIKPSKSKKGTVAIAVLALVLVAVIVVGVNAVKSGTGDILSVFKKATSTESTDESTSAPATQTTESATAEKTTEPSKQSTTESTTESTSGSSTESTTEKDESKTTKPSESSTAATKTSETEKTTVPSTTGQYTTTTKEYTTTAYTTTTKEYTTTAYTTTRPYSTTVPATAAQTLKKPDKYYSTPLTRYATVNGASVRLRPSSASSVCSSLSVGGEVKVYGEENGFSYVYYPRYGVYGWVDSGLLAKERPVAESEVKVSGVVSPDKTYSNPKTKTVAVSEGLRLRKGPGTNYDTIRYLGKGYPVSVKGESSKNPGWVYVTDITRGISGWVSAAYIK